MFGIYTKFGLYSNYSYNKNRAILYFINLISYRANFAISGPTFLFDHELVYHLKTTFIIVMALRYNVVHVINVDL